MQDEHWRPLYDWVADEFGVKLRSTEGLVAPPQDKDTTAKLRQAIESMGHWELAGENTLNYQRSCTDEAQPLKGQSTRQSRS